MRVPYAVGRVGVYVRTHVSLIAFICGFVWDAFTLRRIDLVYENTVFIAYLLIAAGGILIIQEAEQGRFLSRVLQKKRLWLPILVQFPMGGLMSGFLIFYTKSASLYVSWPFILLLVVFFVGNEYFRRRYEQLCFQLGMLYFALSTYFVLTVPIVLGAIGTSAFMVALIASLGCMALFLQLFMRLYGERYRAYMKEVWLIIGGIFTLLTLLYFSNTIPPVPLALKEGDMYHSVVKAGLGYRVMYEEKSWVSLLPGTGTTLRLVDGAPAYCFSAIFAPTRISTNIYHVWEYKGEKGWEVASRIPFPIAGGREAGYRGYTAKAALVEGSWRCSVETERGAVLGRIPFRVQRVSVTPVLREGVR